MEKCIAISVSYLIIYLKAAALKSGTALKQRPLTHRIPYSSSPIQARYKFLSYDNLLQSA
jgi:hypothetical protein